MRKSLTDQLREYLEKTAAWTVMAVCAVIFVVAAAVTLTFVWAYTRR